MVGVTLAGWLGGCSAFQDGTPSPIPDSPDTPVITTPVEPPNGAPPDPILPFPPACTQETLTLTQLGGSALPTPLTPPSLAAAVVHRYGGQIRASTFVTDPGTGLEHAVWSEGSALHLSTMEAAVELGAVVNVLAGMTDATASHLVVGAQDGLYLIPVVSTTVGPVLGTSGRHVAFVGEVTSVTVVQAVTATPLTAIPASVLLSLNTPVPGTEAYLDYPPTIYFTTASGAAYRYQGNCLTQIFTPVASGDGDQTLRAVALAADLHHAAILTEVVIGPQAKLEGLRALLHTRLPELDGETEARLLAQAAHLARLDAAWQQIQLIDLVTGTTQTLKSFGGSVGNDAIISDLAFYRGALLLAGIFFNRPALNSAVPSEADRWKIWPALWDLQTSTEKPSVGTLMQPTLLFLDPNAPSSTPVLSLLPAKTGATIPALAGRLLATPHALYFVGPRGYIARWSSPDAPPTLLPPDPTTSSTGNGFPRAVSSTQAQDQLAIVRLDAPALTLLALPEGTLLAMTEEIPLPAEPARAKTIAGMTYLLYDAHDSGQFGILNLHSGKRTLFDSPATTMAAVQPSLVVDDRFIDIAWGAKTPYVVVATSLRDVSTQPVLQSGELMAYPFANLPGPGENPEAKAVATLPFTLGPQGSPNLFADMPMTLGGARRLVDMRTFGDRIVLLLESDDSAAAKRHYRLAVFRLNPGAHTITPDSDLVGTPSGLSAITSVTAQQHTRPVRLLAPIPLSFQSRDGLFALQQGKLTQLLSDPPLAATLISLGELAGLTPTGLRLDTLDNNVLTPQTLLHWGGKITATGGEIVATSGHLLATVHTTARRAVWAIPRGTTLAATKLPKTPSAEYMTVLLHDTGERILALSREHGAVLYDMSKANPPATQQ